MHKQHCSSLAASVVPKYSHIEEECELCLEVAAKGGREAVADPLSPLYPCILKSLDGTSKSILSHHPFPLHHADPADRIERLVILIKKLLVKMAIGNHKVMENCTQEVHMLMNIMDYNRLMLWKTRKTHPHPGAAVNLGAHNLEEKTWQAMVDKSGRRHEEYILSDDEFRIFDTCEILFNAKDYIEGPVTTQRDFKDPEKMLPEDMLPMVARAKKSTFLPTVDRLLDALDRELLPYSEVVRIICNGETMKNCSICDELVNVTEITQNKKRLGTAATFFNTLNMGVVRCEDPMCNLVHNELPSRKDYGRWYPMILMTATKFKENLCHFCFKLSSHGTVHRCGKCLTKVYCSKICQTEDWEVVHSKICKGKADPRKVKGKAQERKEVGQTAVKECVEKVEEQHLEFTTQLGFFDPERFFDYGRMVNEVKKLL